MATRFEALSATEKAAITDHVRSEYDKLVFQHPTDYVTRNAQADPGAWQKALCDMIVSDRDRVEEITRAAQRRLHKSSNGFTLIELSIVLVIIGLIVGGVLVGQDLIRAAEVRAQISQIEKFNTAVNTFRGKYGALPGDLNAQVANQFGFTQRGTGPGMGDGNGVIEGCYGGTTAQGFLQGGEPLAFWVDLTVGKWNAPINVNLIEGSFTAYTGPSNSYPTITASNAASYLPPAKIGKGNYVYVYSTGSTNYFGVAPMTMIGGANGGPNALTASMTVQQAYQIDNKIDDGFPATGNVTATWDSGNGTASGAPAENAPAPTVNAAASDSTTSCYNSSTTAGTYSLSISNGAYPNCALSFRFQ